MTAIHVPRPDALMRVDLLYVLLALAAFVLWAEEPESPAHALGAFWTLASVAAFLACAVPYSNVGGCFARRNDAPTYSCRADAR